MRLLGIDNETVHPPEFHKALNLEYRVRHQAPYDVMCTAVHMVVVLSARSCGAPCEV